MLLLCGGDKSTQEQDILKAQEYWLDYRSFLAWDVGTGKTKTFILEAQEYWLD